MLGSKGRNKGKTNRHRLKLRDQTAIPLSGATEGAPCSLLLFSQVHGGWLRSGYQQIMRALHQQEVSVERPTLRNQLKKCPLH